MKRQMASKSRYRLRTEATKHSNLFSQQRRLRHLTCIVGRNIDPNLVPSPRPSTKISLLSLYFTIHSHNDLSNVLYKSELIENTLNPNWREFDAKVFSKYPQHNTASSITVCIWGARKATDQFKIILRYDVHFSGLIYVKEQLYRNEESYESNSLLFQMFCGYYAAPSILQKEKVEERKLTETIKVTHLQVRSSYKQTSLMRAHEVMKAIQQTRQQVNAVQQHMNNLLLNNERFSNKCSQRELLIFKNGLLRQEIQRLQEMLVSERKLHEKVKESYKDRADTLQCKKDDLELYISEMKMKHSAHIRNREALTTSSNQLKHRRRQLAAELSYIYPIVELPMKTNDNKRDYAICGIRLPNSEDFIGENDNMLSVALGNTAQLVYMMAKFMELPLRYPVFVMGSRSSVVDVVTDKLTDKERNFPLYLKGKEKFQFHYGVFLLNKNIAQLRYHNDLGTSDLRNTLENLKRLLEDKFGVRIVLKPGNTGVRNVTQGYSTYPNNKTSAQLSRHASLPTNSLHKNIFSDQVDFAPDSTPPKLQRSFRPRSVVLSSSSNSLSGLSMVNKGPQHPYILKKSSQRKSTRDSTSSLPQSISPDLITASCDEIVQMAGQTNIIKDMMKQEDKRVSESDSDLHKQNRTSTPTNESLVDFEEESTEDKNELPESNKKDLNRHHLNGLSPSHSNTMRRSISETLIIPDPFEGEPDELLSPDSNLNLADNIVV